MSTWTVGTAYPNGKGPRSYGRGSKASPGKPPNSLDVHQVTVRNLFQRIVDNRHVGQGHVGHQDICRTWTRSETSPVSGADRKRNRAAGQSQDEVVQPTETRSSQSNEREQGESADYRCLDTRIPELAPAVPSRANARNALRGHQRREVPRRSSRRPSQRRSWLYRFFFGP